MWFFEYSVRLVVLFLIGFELLTFARLIGAWTIKFHDNHGYLLQLLIYLLGLKALLTNYLLAEYLEFVLVNKVVVCCG
jgi:hypothetical protein